MRPAAWTVRAASAAAALAALAALTVLTVLIARTAAAADSGAESSGAVPLAGPCADSRQLKILLFRGAGPVEIGAGPDVVLGDPATGRPLAGLLARGPLLRTVVRTNLVPVTNRNVVTNYVSVTNRGVSNRAVVTRLARIATNRTVDRRALVVRRLETSVVTTNLAAWSRAHAVVRVAADGGLVVDGLAVPAGALLFAPRTGDASFRGYPWRGRLLVTARGRELSVINVLDIEEYLKGVLPHEIDPGWEPEALKSQAIASRSYAYAKRQENRAAPYDMENTVNSQVYLGSRGERASTSAAVDETAGLVLWWSGGLAAGFFHASCGGATEDSARVWGTALPYLKGKPSPWCRPTKHGQWGIVIDRAELARLFGIREALAAAVLTGRTASGRALGVRLVGVSGKAWWYAGTAFRAAVGLNRAKSALFTVDVRGPYLRVVGGGWGHGVGLCQWCAAVLAKQGMGADRILAHFYDGTTVAPYRLRATWP